MVIRRWRVLAALVLLASPLAAQVMTGRVVSPIIATPLVVTSLSVSAAAPAISAPTLSISPLAILPSAPAVTLVAAPSAASAAIPAKTSILNASHRDDSGSSFAGLSLFDGSKTAQTVTVDYPGIPNERLQGAASSTIEALRTFRKKLKTISQGTPLKKEHANHLIQKARELGVPIRIHARDLQENNNHWKRGPHIHLGTFHIPVEAGYIPELLPGFINLN